MFEDGPTALSDDAHGVPALLPKTLRFYCTKGRRQPTSRIRHFVSSLQVGTVSSFTGTRNNLSAGIIVSSQVSLRGKGFTMALPLIFSA